MSCLLQQMEKHTYILLLYYKYSSRTTEGEKIRKNDGQHQETIECSEEFYKQLQEILTVQFALNLASWENCNYDSL
jgi:hypothetical protein